MKILVTIPAYNEGKTIGMLIQKIKKVLDGKKYNHEIMVVDDGSTDNTRDVAERAGAEVFSHQRNFGLAETFRTEMERVAKKKADVIVHIDADMQYLPEEMPSLLEPIAEGKADLVLGSRFLGKIEKMPLIKKWGNRAFSRVITNITGIKITDGQTGFRAFTKKVAEEIKITSTHTYTQEMIIRAVKNKYRIKEVPVTFKKREGGGSRLMSNPLSFAVKAWVNIIRVYRDYEPLKFFGGFGLFLMSIGLLIGIYILWLLFNSGFGFIDTKIPTILLGTLFFLGGLQILLFGFLADKK